MSHIHSQLPSAPIPRDFPFESVRANIFLEETQLAFPPLFLLFLTLLLPSFYKYILSTTVEADLTLCGDIRVNNSLPEAQRGDWTSKPALPLSVRSTNQDRDTLG